jgi:hypothetical protein
MFDDVLMPLRGKAFNKMPIYAFDVETEHVRSDFKRKNNSDVKCYRQDFVLGSVVGNNLKRTFRDRNEMAEFLLSREMRDSLIYAHNLEFDFGILYGDRLNEFQLVHRHRLLSAVKVQEEERIRHDRLKEGQTERKELRKRVWRFLDTLNYANMSLERIGEKIVKQQKLPYPKCMEKTDGAEQMLARRPRDEEEWDELEKYNLQDSSVTYLFAEKFREFCNTHNCRMKMTIASTGMDWWRRNAQKYPMKKEPDDLVRKHFLGSFRGGITNVYKRGTYDGRMWYFDYNSSYPARMVEGVDGKGNYPFPGSYAYRENPSIGLLEEYDGICRASVTAPYSYFPMLSWKEPESGKLLNPYGTYEGWFTNHELRLAMDNNYEVQPKEMIYYHEQFKPFREAVEFLYKLRQKYRDDDNPFQEIVKLFMNSGLFGKWGTNFTKMEEVFTEDKIRFDADGRAWIDDREIRNYKLGSQLITVKKENQRSMRYSFPILSEYTTMLGRIKLWDNCQGKEKYLCMNDTDSVLATNNCFEDSKELGKFKLEDTNDRATTIRPKNYAMRSEKGGWTTKTKGVGRFMKGESAFYKGLRDGYVDMSRFSRLKESYKAGIKPGSVIVFRKKLGFEDDKRDWQGKSFRVDDWQDSEPLKLNQGLLPKDVRKALQANREKIIAERNAFLNSDLFDSHSVGKDISRAEFLKNEMDMATKGY